jgi:hypothetical protein
MANYRIKLNDINTVVMIVMTLVATAATVRSCEVSIAVADDERQFRAIDSLVKFQQTELNSLQSEVTESKKATSLLSKENLTVTSMDNKMGMQLNKISQQLILGQKQQKIQALLSRLERKSNIERLRIARRHLEELLINNDVRAFAYEADEQSVLPQIKSILESEMKNPILLEDDSMSLHWNNVYSELSNTQIALNTDIAHFSSTRQENGKTVVDNSQQALEKYRQSSVLNFAKTLQIFAYKFAIFMNQKNKELKIEFE